MYAKVAVSAATYAFDSLFDYSIPEDMKEYCVPGMRVLVPFGNGNRKCEGIVLAISEECDAARYKEIFELLDSKPLLSGRDIELAAWMRERLYCTYYDAIKAILPAGSWFGRKEQITLNTDLTDAQLREVVGRSGDAAAIVELLLSNSGKMELSAIKDALGRRNIQPAMKKLIDSGAVFCDVTFSKKTSDKTLKLISLSVPPQEMVSMNGRKLIMSPARRSVMDILDKIGEASVKEVIYYTGVSPAVINGMCKNGMLKQREVEVYRGLKLENISEAKPLSLTDEQTEAYNGLSALTESNKASAALLFGITGSGKTSIYINLIKKVVASGRKAIVLVPEIALTPQMCDIFHSYFPNRVAVMHSGLAVSERYDQWKRIKNGEVDVALGTRSAVFAPFENIGIIIADEEQDQSYKSENSPRYSAIDIAKYRCVQHRALLLLGSATPSVESMYAAESGRYSLFKLENRYSDAGLPEVICVNMRDEIKSGNGGTISSRLAQEIKLNLENHQQTILFINRRGNARYIQCTQCGYIPECDSCSTSLSYHSANGRLMCHYCGKSKPNEPVCPECGGRMITVGSGTQKVAQELQELFPECSVLRMDSDTTSGKNSHEQILDKFRARKADILLGTQMVTKGLDFENVTLVGVLSADMSLFTGDFRAYERTFSLLTQVVGRAGRGKIPGRAVLQAMSPEHEVIKAAVKQDYLTFYQDDIAIRKVRNYPPFSDIISFMLIGESENRVLQACTRLANMIGGNLDKAFGAGKPEVLGPAPAFITKINNKYRYRLLLLRKNDKRMREFVAWVLKHFAADKRNSGITIYADTNPIEI